MDGVQLTQGFLWMGFNWLKAIEPLRGDSLLFTTKFPEIPGTDLIDLDRHWVELGAIQWFWTRKLYALTTRPTRSSIGTCIRKGFLENHDCNKINFTNLD